MTDWGTVATNIRERNWSPFLTKIYRPVYSLLPHDGIDVPSQDWDNLIVLDACRYDAFEQVNTIPGSLEKVTSKGSKTGEWVTENFSGDHQDIVYVSGNPHVSDKKYDFMGYGVSYLDGSEHFHDCITAFLEDDAGKGVVLPETVKKKAVKANEDYPEKRLITHFMQPHIPFIGEPSIMWETDGIERLSDFFRHPDAWEAYLGNLELVLQHVEEILEELEGKTVITADHGELFGEKGLYGHREGVYTKELVEVPWLTVDPEY